MDFEWVADAMDSVRVPRNARLRLTRRGLTVVPVTHAHRTTARRIANQIEARLPGWTPVGGFAVVPSREGCTPEPDAGALPLGRVRAGESEVGESLLPFVVEVASPEGGQEHTTSPDHYARRGIPAYLVVDVRAARWTLLTRPAEGEYRHAESGFFGERIGIPVAGRVLVLDSSEFQRI
ncbi:Uma2 family endonuclease [Streptomyces niveiscabiei]|uniref:Uma2 family endonuclease n=1 Tax=Streptomyces niveiscabiei TaxID=164115 RepID=UPI0029AF3AC3|nr:Uma2 family endonuclease [Streptomyces niveiscabiei]MDX3381086.1 Uma2 family endonuclease [Streptomyces niveiscabiei]